MSSTSTKLEISMFRFEGAASKCLRWDLLFHHVWHRAPLDCAASSLIRLTAHCTDRILGSKVSRCAGCLV
jgi:hypothetical protein